MTDVTCGLTAKNQDQLLNPTLGNRVWATFAFFTDFTGMQVASAPCRRCLNKIDNPAVEMTRRIVVVCYGTDVLGNESDRSSVDPEQTSCVGSDVNDEHYEREQRSERQRRRKQLYTQRDGRSV